MPLNPQDIPFTPFNKSAQTPSNKAAQDLYNDLAAAHGDMIANPAPQMPIDPSSGQPAANQNDPYNLYTFGDGTQAVFNGAGQLLYYAPKAGAEYSNVKEAPSQKPGNAGKNTMWGTNTKTGQYEEITGSPVIDPTADKIDVGQHPAQPMADGTMQVWDPKQINPKTGKPGVYVDSGAPANQVVAQTATANLNKIRTDAKLTNAQANLSTEQLNVLKTKTPVEIDELEKRGDLSAAQAEQIRALLPGAVTQQTAVTAKTNAETGLTDAQTKAVIGKTPAEIDQLVADGTLKQAQADQIKQAMQLAGATQASEIDLRSAQAANQRAQAQAAGKPTQMQAPSDQMWIYTQDNQGNVQTTLNKNYQPKDPAYAVVQLQAQQKQYADTLQKQVTDGTISKEQAAQQWDEWNRENVEPLKQGIQQAQQQLAFTNQNTAAQTAATTTDAAANAQNAATNNYNAQVAAQTAAGNIGKQAVDAALALPAGMTRVGPGFGTEMNKISSAMANNQQPGNIDWNAAMVYNPPDMGEIYKNATAAALAHISPMAAQITGAPQPTPPGQMDLNSLLNRSWDQYSATAAPASAGGGAASGSTGGAPAFVGSPSATAAAAGGSPGPFQPSSNLTSAATLATQPTPPALMNPGSPEYTAWLNANMGKYQLAAA